MWHKYWVMLVPSLHPVFYKLDLSMYLSILLSTVISTCLLCRENLAGCRVRNWCIQWSVSSLDLIYRDHSNFNDTCRYPYKVAQQGCALVFSTDDKNAPHKVDLNDKRLEIIVHLCRLICILMSINKNPLTAFLTKLRVFN